MVISLVVGAACLLVFAVLWSHRATDAAMTYEAASEELEREIREALPVGSSVTEVQDFLGKRGLEFSFDKPSGSVFAVARRQKSSTPVVSKSLQLQFRFGEDMKLKSIEARILFTGP